MANPLTSKVFNFQVVNKFLHNYVEWQFQSIIPMAFYVHINQKYKVQFYTHLVPFHLILPIYLM